MAADRLTQAFRGQRQQIAALLLEAGVAPVDAELLLLNALDDVSEMEWQTKRTTANLLLERIDARCRSFAAALRRSYRGLPAQPLRRPAARGRQDTRSTSAARRALR